MDIKQNKLEFAKTPVHLSQFLDFISHFQAMDPLRRKVNVHVEYESESWANAFNLNKNIAKLCRLFATSFDSLENEMPIVEAVHHFCRTVRRVLKAIIHWDPRVSTIDGVKESSRLVKGISHQDYHTLVSHSAGLFRVIDYNVALSPVSFHHPLHWLLSQLLENTKLLQDDVLHQVGWTLGLGQMIQTTFDSLGSNQFLNIVEYPIRTLTLLSQISCGVWVRNGRNMVLQMHSYQDISFRPNTLDNDIHLLQIGFTLCDRNQILLTLIDRFQLLDWFNGNFQYAHNVYDSSQKKHMIEELLNLLIIIATEHDKLSGASSEQKVRRFIIQYLALSNLSYSELLKMIPSKLNDGSFETYLSDMATFKPPTGLDDKGLYELKPEYMDKLNPYFWHYSRNQREEAQEALRKHYNRLNPTQPLKEMDEYLFVPQLDQSNLGPFKQVAAFLHSRVFCEIITYSLLNYANIFKDGNSDTILDLTLHLALLATIDSERMNLEWKQETMETLTASYRVPTPTFIDNAVNDSIPESQNTNLLSVIFDYLSDNNGRFSHTHKRMYFLLDKFASNGSSDTKALIEKWTHDRNRLNRSAASGSKGGSEISDLERKKAAAKARQAAIMSQMANAQAQFMENHSEMYDEFEEEEERGNAGDLMDLCESNDDDNLQDDDAAEVVRMCHFPTENCIVCQEQLNDSQLFGVLAFVQNSNIQRTTPSNNKEVWADILHASEGTNPWQDGNVEERTFKGFPTEAHTSGMVISSCNHMMHADCFSRYQDAIEAQLLHETLRGNSHTFFNGRYLCPLCKSLGNTLVPLIWRGKKESYPGVLLPRSSFSELRDNALHLRTELSLKIEEIHNPDYNGASFVNTDSNIFLNHVDLLKLMYNQLNLTVAKSQIAIPDDSHIDGNDLALIDCLKSLYSIYTLTISKFEIDQRGGSASTKTKDPTVEYTGTLMDDIPTSAQRFLKILGLTNGFLPKLLSSSWDPDEMLAKECLALNALKKVFPSDFSIFNQAQPLLWADPFEMLVLLGFSANEYPQVEPHHVLRSMYIAELTKTVICIFQSVLNGEDTWNDASISTLLNGLISSQPNQDKEKAVVDFVTYVLRLLNIQSQPIFTLFQTIHPSALLSLIRTFTLPFIRKSLVFMVTFHGLILQTPEDDEHSQMSEYNYLLKILGLPSPEDIFKYQATENDLIPGWCHHLVTFSTTTSAISNTVVLQYLKLFLPIRQKLVTLPYRLDELFDESLKRVCLRCNTVPEYSAICLICGQFVCARRFCCTENERGECNIHMRTCGGDIGMYLIIKDCFILLLHRDGGGTVMGAPYLDSHGEPDLFLKRGTPQYLNTKRYEQLQQMWTSQTVATYVQRCMDSASATASWEYF
ncbi:hypothetical protein K501DRAFT_224899 [Backusella circina FSU 941]|nr:hypothetical protein K501DRAFT_224899 [Backusella circina FSU 941]